MGEDRREEVTSVVFIFVSPTGLVCRDQGEAEVVFVGLHARRGDLIQKWKSDKNL